MWELKQPKYGLIGHRGAIEHAPENTLASFIKAHEIGLNMVEFDIRLTADEQWVVFHDDDTSRLTDTHRVTRESTAKELTALKVAGAHPIPLFSEILPQLQEMGMHMNIELKTDPSDAKIALKRFLPILKRWPRRAPPPLVSAFDHALIVAIRKASPHVHLGLLTEDNEHELFSFAQALKRCAVHFNVDKATPKDLVESQNTNTPLLYYTCNDAAKAKKLLEGGAWGLFTDRASSIIPEL